MPSVVVAPAALLARRFDGAALAAHRLASICMRFAITTELRRLLAEIHPPAIRGVVPAAIDQIRIAPAVEHVWTLVDSRRSALHANHRIRKQEVRPGRRRCYGGGATCYTGADERSECASLQRASNCCVERHTASFLGPRMAIRRTVLPADSPQRLQSGSEPIISRKRAGCFLGGLPHVARTLVDKRRRWGTLAEVHLLGLLTRASYWKKRPQKNAKPTLDGSVSTETRLQVRSELSLLTRGRGLLRRGRCSLHRALTGRRGGRGRARSAVVRRGRPVL